MMNIEWHTYMQCICVLQICVKTKQLGGKIMTEKNTLLISVFILYKREGKGTLNDKGKFWDCLGEVIPSHWRPPTERPSQKNPQKSLWRKCTGVSERDLLRYLRVDFWFIGHYLWLSGYGRLAHLHVCTALRYRVVR